MSSSVKSVRKACRVRLATGANKGVARRRAMVTTCEISQAANRLVDVARVWLRVSGQSASKGVFMDAAVAELTRRLMRENPGFTLPPGVSFDFMADIEPKGTNEGNA